MEHPSGRHSRIDWSRPVEDMQAHAPALDSFGQARLNEVILQAGDSLYLPTAWFHAIVSLNVNYQCNARSGMTKENFLFIRKCGFGGRPAAS
jgi:mannose-6-phosphate isomerase class I